MHNQRNCIWLLVQGHSSSYELARYNDGGGIGNDCTYHHIVLFFRDTEGAKQWYSKVGFEYARGYEQMHWFSVGDSEIMLHPAETGSGNSGLVVKFATPDVQALFDAVVEAGLEPFDHQQPGKKLSAPVTRPWGAKEFELLDPEGHIIAFIEA